MTDYLSPTLLDHFASGLSPRDQLVLESVGKLGWLLSGQIARLHFVDSSGKVQDRRCRDVLARLHERHWLQRHPDRRVGAAYGGSGQYAYALDLAGQRFIAGAAESRRRRKADDAPTVSHALAVAELYVQLIELQAARQLDAVGFLPEFPGLLNLRPDALAALVPASGDLMETRRWFLEVELSRKDADRLDQKLAAYVAAWREAETRYGWSHFPRVLYVIGTLSQFPSDTGLIWREVEGAIRRQPSDARKLFALTAYANAAAVVTGTHQPVTVPADADDGDYPAAAIDPATLVLRDADQPDQGQ